MQPKDLEDSFLTVAEVAEILKINPQTVRNWIDQGSLPALRVGRRVRIKRSDFERVVEQGYRPGLSPPEAGGPNAADFWGGEPVDQVGLGHESGAGAAETGQPGGTVSGRGNGRP